MPPDSSPFDILNMTNSQITLHSPYSIKECIEKIDNSLEKSLFSQYGSKPLAGKVSYKSLQIRKRIDYRNSFQTIFSAKMMPSSSGTEITGKMGLHPFAKKFSIFWIVGVFLLGGPPFLMTLIDAVRNGYYSANHSIVGFIVFPAMIIFAFVVFKVGKRFSESEANFIIESLTNILSAKIIEPVEQPASQGFGPKSGPHP